MFYNVYVICAFAALGGALFGFDIASRSGILDTEAYKRYFDHPASYRQGGITTAMPAGSFVGSLCSSFLTDRLSRRTAIQIGAFIFIIGTIFQAACNGSAILCVGRAISRILHWNLFIDCPCVSVGDRATRNLRTLRVITAAITWGILIQYFIQYGASFVDGGAHNPAQSTKAFRIPWGIQALPGALLFFGLFLLPSSPRWLASKSRQDEAIYVLGRLHGRGDASSPVVVAEMQEIEEQLRYEREEAQTGFKALVKPGIFKRVILGMCVQMWSQLCGMNIMMYYIVYIMRGAHIADELMTSSIQYIINVVMTLPAILYLDKVGRRPALIYGSLLMAMWLFISGTLQGAYDTPNTDPKAKDDNLSWVIPEQYKAVSKAIVFCSYMFVATFATTMGPTSWTYPAEIYPAKVRAKAVSLATASNWLWNCILAFAVPPLLWLINWKVYMIFATFNVLGFLNFFFMVRETKGIPLEEMDLIFDSKIPAWKASKYRTQIDQVVQDAEKGNTTPVTHPNHVENIVVEPKL